MPERVMRTLACCLVLTCATVAGAAAPPARDAALPQGARMRLGTPRLRFSYHLRQSHDSLVLSSDRKMLATSGPGRTAEVFDFRTSRLLFRFQPPNEDCAFLYPLAFSHDGKVLAVSEESSTFVSLWPLRMGARPKLLHSSPLDASNGRLPSAAFLPGDKQLATFDGETLVVWDVAKGKRLREDRLRSLEDAPTFSPDGRLFAAQIGDSIVLTDLVSGRWWRIALPTADDEQTTVRWSWSNDGRFIALATTSNRLRIHDAKTGRLVRELPRSARSLPPTAFSPDGRALAIEAESGVLVYDVIRGKLQREIRIDLPPYSGLANLAYRDDNHLLVVDDWAFERTFDLRTGKEVMRPGHRLGVTGLAFTANGRSLVSVDGSGRLLRWDLWTGKLSAIGRVSKGERRDWKLSLSANGKTAGLLGQVVGSAEFATFDLRQGFVGWRKKEWTVPYRAAPGFPVFPALDDTVTCSISPDSRLVAAPLRAAGKTKDSMVDVVVVLGLNGEKLWAFDSRFDPKQTFSPDSRELALSADQHDNTVLRLLDLRTGKARLTLKAGQKETGAIRALNFSPDGRLIVAADEGCLYVWERVTGEGIDRIALPNDFSVTQLLVKRDGRVLALGFLGWFHEIHSTSRAIWDSTTAKPLLVTSAFLADCPSRLSDDGRTLAVGCEDSSILLYEVPQPTTRKSIRLDDAEQQRLWADLSADAARAWRARQRLARAPKDALALLSKHLKPAPARSIKELADLDADDFAMREAAARKLAAALRRGDRGIEAALRDLLASPPSLEPFLRAQRLLAQATPIPFTAEELRVIRAVGVLEQIGDGGAKALLKRLCQGGPSLLTAEARATLARLAKP
jgi:WD40 repeat protein